MQTPNSSSCEQTHDQEKNHIHCLQTEEGLAFSNDDKEKIITDHFRQHLGTTIGRPATFNWSSLGYQARELSSLEEPFSQQEIKGTIDSMPPDKAPSPDGFTGIFFKDCWEIIKDDLTAAFNQLHNLNAQGFDLLNSVDIYFPPPQEVGCHQSWRLPANKSNSQYRKNILKIVGQQTCSSP